MRQALSRTWVATCKYSLILPEQADIERIKISGNNLAWTLDLEGNEETKWKLVTLI